MSAQEIEFNKCSCGAGFPPCPSCDRSKKEKCGGDATFEAGGRWYCTRCYLEGRLK